MSAAARTDIRHRESHVLNRGAASLPLEVSLQTEGVDLWFGLRVPGGAVDLMSGTAGTGFAGDLRRLADAVERVQAGIERGDFDG